MPVCAAYGCHKRTGGKSKSAKVSFFQFPLKETARLRQWEQRLGRKDFRPNKYSSLCQLHFEDDRFIRDLQQEITGVPCYSKKRLCKDAVPTKFHLDIDGVWQVGPASVAVTTQQLGSVSDSRQRATGRGKRPERAHTVKRLQKKEQTDMVRKLLTPETKAALGPGQKKPRNTPGQDSSKKPPSGSTSSLSKATYDSSRTEAEVQVQIRPLYGNPEIVFKDHSYATSQKQEIESSSFSYVDLSEACNSVDIGPTEEVLFSDENQIEHTEDETEDEKEVSDDLYLPSSTEESDFFSDEEHESERHCFLVFEENLSFLMRRCQECGAPIIDKTKRINGTMVIYQLACHEGHTTTWSSQPSIRKMPVGNLKVAAATLYSGLTYTRIASFANAINLAMIKKSTFHEIQRSKLFPVVQEAWQKEKESLYRQRRGKKLVLSGDCRCDSPGHCAKYGNYTIMDAGNEDEDGLENSGGNKILSLQVVQCTEVKNSNQMEPEGLRRALSELSQEDMEIKILATDRHIQVKKIMATEYGGIDHQFDVWHAAKSVVKKLTEKAKLKRNADLQPWIQSISNHLWWSCAECKGDETELRERWISILHHVLNKHRWTGCKKFRKCDHPPLSNADGERKAWLKRDSPSFQALQEVVMDKNLLAALPHLVHFCHTGNLEAFHNLILKYCPKRQHFGYEGMTARAMLGALDWNTMERRAVLNPDGTQKQEQVFSKRRKKWVLRSCYHRVSGKQVEALMERTLQVEKERLQLPPIQQPTLPKNISRTEKPELSAAIAGHTSRF